MAYSISILTIYTTSTFNCSMSQCFTHALLTIFQSLLELSDRIGDVRQAGMDQTNIDR